MHKVIHISTAKELRLPQIPIISRIYIDGNECTGRVIPRLCTVYCGSVQGY